MERGKKEEKIILTVSINQTLLKLVKFAHKEEVRDEKVMIKMKGRERRRENVIENSCEKRI